MYETPSKDRRLAVLRQENINRGLGKVSQEFDDQC